MQPKCQTGRLIFFIILSWFALVGLLGCNSKTPIAAPSRPFEGQTLRVAAPAVPLLRELLQRHGHEWTERVGATIDIVAEDAPADVRLFQPFDMGRLAPTLAPLDLSFLRGLEAFEYSRLLRYQIERNMDWGGSPRAMPVLGESLVCVYRADLCADPRHAEALSARFRQRFRHPLRPTGPATWQEIEELARYFASQPTWGAGDQVATPRPSLPPLAARDDEFDRDFHVLAASFVRRAVNEEAAAKLSEKQKTDLFFTYHLNADSGEPTIAAPGFVAAVEMHRRLQAFRPTGTADQPLDAFRSGQAVAAIVTIADLARLQQTDSAVRDRFAIARIPGSEIVFDFATGTVGPAPDPMGNLVPYHGHAGWMGGVDAKAAKPPIALDLLTFLSSPRTSLEAVCEPSWGAGPTRSTHIDNASGWHNYGLSNETSGQLVAALDAYYRTPILNAAYRLRIVDQRRYQAAFVAAVRPAMTDQRPAAEVLGGAANAWRALASDRAALAQEYRQSVGLR